MPFDSIELSELPVMLAEESAPSYCFGPNIHVGTPYGHSDSCLLQIGERPPSKFFVSWLLNHGSAGITRLEVDLWHGIFLLLSSSFKLAGFSGFYSPKSLLRPRKSSGYVWLYGDSYWKLPLFFVKDELRTEAIDLIFRAVSGLIKSGSSKFVLVSFDLHLNAFI